MAAYPTLTTTIDSTLTPTDGQVVDYMEDGVPRVRNYSDVASYAGTLVHILNNDDMETLLTFYNTNRLLSFTFTWAADGTGSPWESSYNLRFAGFPRWRRIVTAAADADAKYRADVPVVGTAA